MEQFNKNSPRLIFKIKADDRFYFLKGIPISKPESVILGNALAHEYLLGKLAKKLHSYTGYAHPSGLNENKQRFYGWFFEKFFKTEFDAILDSLPDFTEYDRCFIHTDLGPHNIMLKADGKLVLIDLDDAGIGSRYLDLGYAFIMQFVEHSEDMQCYGYEAVDSLWKILRFGMKQK